MEKRGWGLRTARVSPRAWLVLLWTISACFCSMSGTHQVCVLWFLRATSHHPLSLSSGHSGPAWVWESQTHQGPQDTGLAARQKLPTVLCKRCCYMPNVFLWLSEPLPAILKMLYCNQLASASTLLLRPSRLNYFRNSLVTKEVSIVLKLYFLKEPMAS